MEGRIHARWDSLSPVTKLGCARGNWGLAHFHAVQEGCLRKSVDEWADVVQPCMPFRRDLCGIEVMLSVFM